MAKKAVRRNFSFFLARRYIRPQRTFVSVITMLSVLGVTLGVMVLLVVLSVMEGFEREIRSKIVGFNAHVTVSGMGGVLEDWRGLAQQLRVKEEVVSASGFVQGPVLVEFQQALSSPVLRGVEVEELSGMLPMDESKWLVKGEALLQGNAVIVGEEWALQQGATVGDKILVYAPRNLPVLHSQKARAVSSDAENSAALETSRRDESKTEKNGASNKVANKEQADKESKDKAPVEGTSAPQVVPVEMATATEQHLVLPTELVITGIFRTGMYDYDLNVMVTSLSNAQYLYALETAVHGVHVRLNEDAPEVAEAFKHRLIKETDGRYMVRTWMDQNRTLFTAVATERVTMTFVLLFIILVAGFGLCSTLITITVQKSKEIGILKALGAREGQIMAIFLWYGGIVGTVGSVLGVGLAWVALSFRNELREGLARLMGVDVFAPEIYNIAQIPAVPLGESLPLVGSIAGIAVAICILAAYIPARSAARLMPAQALRYE
ncbi:MAG: ABC transporter permease [Methylacidiphilales bacterium]|nr:ABC transporter permease [Candidatus Methylacidiphilales bacterium]MDW8349061.1 ABC transporter permease [Verrucomicrobiae bacterium]